MIEKFTAAEAADAGLMEAIKSGRTKIIGIYELNSGGAMDFEQDNFVFYDKTDKLRTGKFKDSSELMKFCRGYEIAQKL